MVIYKSYLFRLCKAAIIRLRTAGVRKEGNHIAVSIHSTINLVGKISSLHISIIAFREHFNSL